MIENSQGQHGARRTTAFGHKLLKRHVEPQLTGAAQLLPRHAEAQIDFCRPFAAIVLAALLLQNLCWPQTVCI